MKQRQVTLKDVSRYVMLESFIGHVCQMHMYLVITELTVSIRLHVV